MTEHTPISPVSRLEVISTGARRRWTLAEKRRIVAESYSAPVSATAWRNGLSASQLFNWRRLAREGRLGEAAAATRFAAAFVADEGSLSSAVSLPEQLKAPETPACSARAEVVPGRIEIVLNCGHRVVVDQGVDATALARVLAVLVRR
jgi:transposase